MTTTLVTGATMGLGREAARRLVGAGHTVYVGARDAARGQAVADELGARLNNHRGTQTVEQGTDTIVRMATLGADSPTGTFVDAAGAVPW